ncbi:MAG: restriction endonuclease subunit S [Opitutales bacterium]
MEVKPGYKQTEAGVIPEGWDAVPLKGKVGIAHGFAFASEHFASHGPYRLATPGHFYEAGGFRDIGEKQKYYVGPVPCDYVLQPGDVIVAMTEQADGLLGSAAVIPDEQGYLHNQRLGRVLVLSPKIQLDYLVYVFNSPNYRAKVRETAAGTKVKHTSPEKLLEISVRLPPCPEQRAIAEALSDVDALLGGLDRLIAKKRGLKQAAMQQLLTGQTRLPGFSGEWKVKRLGDVGEISSSGVDKKNRPGEEPVRLVNYMDVYRRAFIYSNDLNHWVTAPSHQLGRCAVQKGDVFFTPSSETRDDIANSAVAMEDIEEAAYSYHVVRLRLREPWDLRFRTYAFKTRVFLSQAETLCDGGGTRYVLSQGRFRNLTVKIPPFPEQTAIAEVLSEMDAELGALEQRREKTRALKQGMMQELLTGRTRLVETAPLKTAKARSSATAESNPKTVP